MRKFNIRKVSEAGSLMVEAIAMLGLISMVTPVVYKKSAERMNELQDINAASQMRSLSAALDAYLSDNLAYLSNGKSDGQMVSLGSNFKVLKQYLPQGMLACSGEEGEQHCGLYGVLGDQYSMAYQVHKPNAKTIDGSGAQQTKEGSVTLTGYIAAKNKEGLDAKRASRIATMIGGNGGVFEKDGKVYGAQGVWEAEVGAGSDQIPLGLGENDDQSIVVASSSAVTGAGTIDEEKFLHRESQNDPKLNTMFTDLLMYDEDGYFNDIMGVGRLLIGEQTKNSANQDVESPEPTNPDTRYSLYVVGTEGKGNGSRVAGRTYGGSAYIQDALKAVEEQFSVEKDALTYNPFTGDTQEVDDGNGGTTNETIHGAKGTFKVGATGLYYTDPEAAEFSLTDNTMTYGSNFIKASTTKDAQGTEGQEGYSAGRDDNSFQVLSKGIDIVDSEGDSGGLDNKGSRVETKTDLFVANHQNDEGNYAYNSAEDNFWDTYKIIGKDYDEGQTDGMGFSMDDVDYDSILSGKTFATDLETAYLKAHNFDVARLRAGRKDLADGDYGWELQADEDSVEMGSYADYLGDSDEAPLQDDSYRAGLRVLDGKNKNEASIRMRVVDNDQNANILELNGGKYNEAEETTTKGGLVATVNNGGVNMTVNNGGDYIVDVNRNDATTGANYGVNADGDISIVQMNGTTPTSAIRLRNSTDTGRTGLAKDALVEISAKKLKDAPGEDAGSPYLVKDNSSYIGEDSNTAHPSFKINNDGTIEMDSVNLKVDNSLATVNKHFENVADDKAQTNNPWVYVRRGSIGVRTDYDETEQGAIEGTGYVLADRFVVENGAEDYTRDPSKVYKNSEGGVLYSGTGSEQYDHYMVDPAYTSVMHDIKLTSRGGARLSDILPDFINKGIYVVDNSYDEGVDNSCFTIYGNAVNRADCNTNLKDANITDYASAYLGGIPAPQCPPGYAKVITLQPSGWTMGQVGTLVADVSGSSKGHGRAYIQPTDNIAALDILGGVGDITHTSQSSCEKILNPNYGQEGEPKYICKDGTGSSASGTWQKMGSGAVQNYSGAINQNLSGDAINAGNVYNELKKLSEAVDRLIQSSTYMKSAIKVKYDDDENTSYGRGSSRTTTGDNFVGWDTYIGFIYPVSYWNNTALKALGFHTNQDDISFNKGVFWNLFPVDKYSIEGYATVYCYFDRNGIVSGGFNESLVDTTYNQFDSKAHRNVAAGSNKYCTGSKCSNEAKKTDYVDRLFNPKLKYNDQW